jgi:hypothetical protein
VHNASRHLLSAGCRWERTRQQFTTLTLGRRALTTISVTLQIAACPNHPQREAIGICVRCRNRVCSECATKVDGINYCVGCLGTLVAGAARTSMAPRSHAGVLLSAAYLATLALLVWGLLTVAFPGSSGLWH